MVNFLVILFCSFREPLFYGKRYKRKKGSFFNGGNGKTASNTLCMLFVILRWLRIQREVTRGTNDVAVNRRLLPFNNPPVYEEERMNTRVYTIMDFIHKHNFITWFTFLLLPFPFNLVYHKYR